MIVKTNGTQKESQILNILQDKKNPILHYDLDYDFTHPEKTIRDFVSAIRAMVSRYDFNRARELEIDQELIDLSHYMEIAPFKNVPDGYRLYRKMAELRRERRACKNENDLLLPVYQYFHATEVLNRLSHVQGECAKAKATIDARTYTVRTDALDEWLNPPKKEEPEPDITDMAEEVQSAIIHLDLPEAK